MSHVPKSISRIYNQFDAVSEQHALVYSVIVRRTLLELSKELEHSHPDVAELCESWAEDIRKG